MKTLREIVRYLDALTIFLVFALILLLVVFVRTAGAQGGSGFFNCQPVLDSDGFMIRVDDGRALALCSFEATSPAPTETDTAAPAATDTPAPPGKASPTPAEATPTPSDPSVPVPGAPACDHPDNSFFHTLWNAQQGCHYDHEHGTSPFTNEVATEFPDIDLRALLGGVEIGHTNPSSEMENNHKHGGFKWQVDVPVPQGCFVGFEGGTVGIDQAVVQYHNFGDESVEFETRFHTTAALLRQCLPGSDDFGYLYTVVLQDYGQRLYHYQGPLMPYPNNPQPAYPVGFGPYFTNLCEYCGLREETREDVLAVGGNVNNVWTSKPTGSGERPPRNPLFMLLFTIQDAYQMVDYRDQEHPFTFRWMCSADGGDTFNPAGCKYNNTTSRVQEIGGRLPAAWDNLVGFDSDPRPGRITGDGFVTRYGDLNRECSGPGPDCYPVKLMSAYVGYYTAELRYSKSNPVPTERDIYFGNQPSGWIGPGN